MGHWCCSVSPLIVSLKEPGVRSYPALELAPPVFKCFHRHHLHLPGLAREAGEKVEGIFDDTLSKNQGARLLLICCCAGGGHKSQRCRGLGGVELFDARADGRAVLDADAQDDLARRGGGGLVELEDGGLFAWSHATEEFGHGRGLALRWVGGCDEVDGRGGVFREHDAREEEDDDVREGLGRGGDRVDEGGRGRGLCWLGNYWETGGYEAEECLRHCGWGRWDMMSLSRQDVK